MTAFASFRAGQAPAASKTFPGIDEFLDEYVPGVPVFSPVLLTESVAQLISWAIIEAKDFTVKPVITILDSYVCTGHPRPGDQLELAGAIESLSPESALAHGTILLERQAHH